jgi:hypothetical protein
MLKESRFLDLLHSTLGLKETICKFGKKLAVL